MNISKILLFSLFFSLLNFFNYFYFFKKIMIFLIIFFIIIFFSSIALCLTVFNDKKYNNILKNRLIFLIIVFPLFGCLFYLIWETINQKKIKHVKKKFIEINTKNFDWKSISWQKNNLTFGDDITKIIKKFFIDAKKTILLQIFSYNDYEFLKNKGLITTLTNIVKTRKIKIFINHNICINKKEIKKYKNSNIIFNKIPIGFNKINLYSTLLIIDGEKALYGSFNNSFHYNFIINGKIVDDLKSCFFNWNNEILQQKQNNLFASTRSNLNEIKSYFQYFGLSLNLNAILLDLIYTAKKSIKIFSNYFLPNNSIKLALQFAIKKNINVKIVTSNLFSNFFYPINFSLNKTLFEQKNLWWETSKKINDSFVIIDDDIVFLTSNFNCDSFLPWFYPIFWFNFQNKQNYFLKIFNDEIKYCSPIKKNKNNFSEKIKKLFYLIIYPFVL